MQQNDTNPQSRRGVPGANREGGGRGRGRGVGGLSLQNEVVDEVTVVVSGALMGAAVGE